MFGKSSKTTIAGILTIIVAGGKAGLDMINGQPFDATTVIAAIMAGIGLIFAKDFNATGGTK